MADLSEQLVKYLTDAHSIEVQALAQLRTAPDLAGDPDNAAAFSEHLKETERHERLVRDLLEKRGASPSRVKDTVMGIGGKGFLLFARLQPDTPGKLQAHALSYEALEYASYELLRRTAERAGDLEVAEVAAQIAAEERAMIDRLTSGIDRSAEASLQGDVPTQLRKYLADAHALEEQAIALLERAPKLAGSERVAAVYSDHLAETRDHAELVAERLQAIGGDPSSLKDAALRLGALQWGAFFQAHPDTPGKLAAFAYAFEHLEIGGYEQLRVVAARARDADTDALAERILAQERAAAERIAAVFDEAVQAALTEQHVT